MSFTSDKPVTLLLFLMSRILVDDTVEIHRKLPFARVLTWTFLNTERDSALACSQLASSRYAVCCYHDNGIM